MTNIGFIGLGTMGRPMAGEPGRMSMLAVHSENGEVSPVRGAAVVPSIWRWPAVSTSP